MKLVPETLRTRMLPREPALEPGGIGIDLISWDRVRRFLSDHSFEFLQRLFTRSEAEAFRLARSPVEFFARRFTAKEAYLKTSGNAGAGERGFSALEVVEKGTAQFRIRFHGKRLPEERAEGEFFETPDGLGAKVVVWKKKN